jgi:hypothetical protein
MTSALWREHILPFTGLLGLLIVATLGGDYLLHRLDLVWVGRYLGIPGTVLIIGSLLYSLRKRKVIASGNPRTLLRAHELSAWLGSLMVLVHSGIHFNAVLPWLATIAMLVNVVSGMVGRMLLDQSRQHVQGQRDKFQLRGMSRAAVEQSLFWDSVTLGAMSSWRSVHIPIFLAFTVLALGHIIAICLFWGWR